nr:ABC transporter ATP-binding protein [Gordonia paraffinivorans]
MLVWLTSRAVAAGGPDVLTVPQWRELWEQHLSRETPETPVAVRPTRPYAGLATLTADDSELFFGRDDLVSTLVDTILATRDAPVPESRLIVVTGVSGSGKSSLLRAGLARDRRLTPPRYGEITADGLRIDASVCRCTASGADAGPRASTCDCGSHPAAVIVIDQFENVFSHGDDMRQTTLRAVEDLAADTVVVVGVRADFFSRCVEYPFLAHAWQHRCVIVSEMTRTQLREVITAPVKPAGGRIESGLADVMITDLYEASEVATVAPVADALCGHLRAGGRGPEGGATGLDEQARERFTEIHSTRLHASRRVRRRPPVEATRPIVSPPHLLDRPHHHARARPRVASTCGKRWRWTLRTRKDDQVIRPEVARVRHGRIPDRRVHFPVYLGISRTYPDPVGFRTDDAVSCGCVS